MFDILRITDTAVALYREPGFKGIRNSLQPLRLRFFFPVRNFLSIHLSLLKFLTHTGLIVAAIQPLP